ncbi:MAG: hypothetical protein K8R69_04430 [Deltaproteobacteria bacterium]|nr:hypothetical protein [Deltaproteobacteria bacterium]
MMETTRQIPKWFIFLALTACSGLASGPTGGSVGGGDTRAVPVTMDGGAPAPATVRPAVSIGKLLVKREKSTSSTNDLTGAIMVKGSIKCCIESKDESPDSELCPDGRILRLVDVSNKIIFEAKPILNPDGSLQFEVNYPVAGVPEANPSFKYFLSGDPAAVPSSLGQPRKCGEDLPCEPDVGTHYDKKTTDIGWIAEAVPGDEACNPGTPKYDDSIPVDLKDPQGLSPKGSEGESLLNQKPKIDLE